MKNSLNRQELNVSLFVLTRDPTSAQSSDAKVAHLARAPTPESEEEIEEVAG